MGSQGLLWDFSDLRHAKRINLTHLEEPHLASVLGYLSLKNIFIAKCSGRFINQLVCSKRSTFGSKLLFQECMAPFLARIDRDPGFLSSGLASNLVQWSNLSKTPALQRSSLDHPSGPSQGQLTQRFLQLDSELARMMACANLKQTKISCTKYEKEGLDMLVASLPTTAKWSEVRYYDAFAEIHPEGPKETAWICQKYGATVSILTPSYGKLELNLVASYELTEVVEERVVYCSVNGALLLHTRSERWIEEENFTSFAPAVNLEEWKKLHQVLFGEENRAVLSVAVIFRLLSTPCVAWQRDNWRTASRGEQGLGRLNFEARSTMMWLRDEFAHVAKLLGSSVDALGSCDVDASTALLDLLRP